MFVIRPEQFEALSAQEFRRFKADLAAHLRANFPERTEALSEAALGETIDTAIERAAPFGITSEDDLQRSLEYVMLYGPDMDTNRETPWIGEILARADLDGTAKLNAMDDHLLFTLGGGP